MADKIGQQQNAGGITLLPIYMYLELPRAKQLQRDKSPVLLVPCLFIWVNNVCLKYSVGIPV